MSQISLNCAKTGQYGYFQSNIHERFFPGRTKKNAEIHQHFYDFITTIAPRPTAPFEWRPTTDLALFVS